MDLGVQLSFHIFDRQILHPSNDLFTIINVGGNIIYELFFLHYSIYGRNINFA